MQKQSVQNWSDSKFKMALEDLKLLTVCSQLIILSSDRSASQTFVTDFNTVMCQSLCILVLKLDHKVLCGLSQKFFIFKKIIKKQKVFDAKKHNVLSNTRP